MKETFTCKTKTGKKSPRRFEMRDAVRNKLLGWGIQVDPSKLHSIYSLSGPPASGKNTVLEVLLLMADHRVQRIDRFTTQRQALGEEQIPHASLDRLHEWEKNGELLEGRILQLQPGISSGTPLRVIHEQLAISPVVCHNPLPSAAFIKEAGYKLRLSRLKPVNQLTQRMREEFQEGIEIPKELFNAPEVVNDFALAEPSPLVDRAGRSISLGAARAALQWLTYIAECEEWNKYFLLEYKIMLGF